MDTEDDKPLNNSPAPPSPSHKDDEMNSVSPATSSSHDDYEKWPEMALEFYNQKNGTDYQVVDALATKGFLCDGLRSHCNFTAKPLNGDGEIPPELFFAEMVRVCKDSPARKHSQTYTWSVQACIVLEGETIEGCIFCTNILHPTDGCIHGIYRSKRKGLPPIVHCSLPEYEKCRRRAEIALEFFNQENGSDYEVEETYLSSCFSSEGTWYHCNFTGWRSVDGKYTRRAFFAEMFGDVGPMLDHLTVTACVNMEGLQPVAGCDLCFNVFHPPPVYFLKGAQLSRQLPTSSLTWMN